MMKFSLFLITLFAATFSFCQVIQGEVLDKDGSPIPFAEVYDTISQNSTTCNEQGYFVLSIRDSWALNIKHPNFEEQQFPLRKADSSLAVNSYVLRTKIQSFEEVIITSERMKRVVDQTNVNIIDYIPYDNVILTLKSTKGRRILSLEGADTTYKSFHIPTGKERTNKLFLDCFNNIHLLSEDSAYQVMFGDSLELLSRASIAAFKRIVKPCVAEFEQNTVFENFTKHRKLYTLTSIDAENDERKHFYHVYDEVEEQVARSYYYQIIGEYYHSVPEHRNVIKLGVWTGDIFEIATDDQYTWYSKFAATPLNIKSFQWGDKLVTMNQHNDSIHVHDESTQLVLAKHYPFAKGSTVFDVLMDRNTGSFYELRLTKGIFSLHEIAVDGESVRSLSLSEVPFCKNIKVHQDWVYFMIQENGFYQINRIYLGSAHQN